MSEETNNNELFQPEPSIDLMDEIHRLGMRCIKEFGEKALGEFLIRLAYQYRTRMFELGIRHQHLEMLKRLEELSPKEGEVEDSPELQEVFDHLKEVKKVH